MFNNDQFSGAVNRAGFRADVAQFDTAKSSLGMSYLLAQSSTPFNVTGTTGVTWLFSATLPGGLLQDIGGARITALVSAVASANAKPMGPRLGGSNLISASLFPAASASGRLQFDFYNRGAGLQLWPATLQAPGQNNASAIQTTAIDTTVDQLLGVVVQPIAVGDSITVEAWRIEVFPAM